MLLIALGLFIEFGYSLTTAQSISCYPTELPVFVHCTSRHNIEDYFYFILIPNVHVSSNKPVTKRCYLHLLFSTHIII